MKKVLQIVSDVAVTVGCCVGVGFISGKEAQVFFGNKLNAIIFCFVFFAVNFAVREYCRKRDCGDIHSLNASLFKHPTPFDTLIALCSFVCIVTALAGVEECIANIVNLGYKLPFFAFFVSFIASLLLYRGMSALKIANVIAVAMSIALLAVIFATKEEYAVENLQVPFFQPVIYALFSLTMSLGVVTKLTIGCSKRDNFITSLLASLILTLLMLAILASGKFNSPMPILARIPNKFWLVFALFTIMLSAITGIVANAIPIAQYLYGVIPDKTVCCALIFGFALALSMFGFDFAVKFGYALVSIMGGVIFVTTIFKPCSKKVRTM